MCAQMACTGACIAHEICTQEQIRHDAHNICLHAQALCAMYISTGSLQGVYSAELADLDHCVAIGNGLHHVML